MNRKKKITYVKKFQKTRKDKRYLHRAEISFKLDRGSFYETHNFTFPEETEHEITLIPKEKQNKNAYYLLYENLIIVFYLDTEKCFVYSVNGKYLANFSIADLKTLFKRIGTVLKFVKSRKSININTEYKR
jgi:hypothetical protein